MKYLFLHIILVIGLIANAQQTPAKRQTEKVTIQGATLHLGNGKVMKNTNITFENGLITAIGYEANTPNGMVINAAGKHVYPGFIVPNSTLGLGELDAVKATIDETEIGGDVPNVRSLIAYNAESQVVEASRLNGVLLAQITPQGGTISGTSSIVQLDAWNWEDAAVKVDDGIHLNWPTLFKSKNEGFGSRVFSEENKEYSKKVADLTELFVQAKNYNQKSNNSRNLGFESLKSLFSGEKKIYIHADLEQEIIDAIQFSKDLNLKDITIVGGGESYKVTDLLKSSNTSVLVKRVHSLPNSEDDDYDMFYKLPALLMQNNILVGLEASGQMDRMNTRNLPFYAGHTTAYGIDQEQALQMITENTAKILGISDKYGTLEVGKSATLFISEGNALDMRTNRLTDAFIDGRKIILKSHQTELYERYRDKYSK